MNTAGTPISAVAADRLRTGMLQMAELSGDAHPESVRAVATTQDKALLAATPGDFVPGSEGRPVFLVVMKGSFTLTRVSRPPNAAAPTGRYLTVTIDPESFRLMDLGLGDQPPPVDLDSYGPVTDLIGPP